jgi:hypothetical protein
MLVLDRRVLYPPLGALGSQLLAFLRRAIASQAAVHLLRQRFSVQLPKADKSPPWISDSFSCGLMVSNMVRAFARTASRPRTDVCTWKVDR